MMKGTIVLLKQIKRIKNDQVWKQYCCQNIKSPTKTFPHVRSQLRRKVQPMEQRRRAGFKVAFVVVCICLFDGRRCICKYAYLCICNQWSQGGGLVLRWRPLKQCLILFVVLLITGIACTYIFAILSLYCSCSRWRSDEEGNPWDGFYLLLAESSVDKVAMKIV